MKTKEKTEKAEKMSRREIFAYLKRLYSLAAKFFWQWGVWRVVGGVGSATVGLLIPRIIGKSLDIAMSGQTELLIEFIVSLAALTVLRWAIGYTNSLSSYRYSILSGRKLRKMSMEKINSLPIAYFESKHTGEVISRVVNDIDKLERFYGDSMGGFWSYLPANIVVGLIILFLLNWQLTLICVAIIPLMTWLIGKISLPISENTKKMAEHATKYNSYLRDFLEGIEIYKIFAMEKRHGGSFNAAVDAETAEGIKKVRRKVMTWAIGSLNYVVPWVLTYAAGGAFVAAGSMTVGELFAFASVMPYMTNVTYQASHSWTSMVETAGTSKHFFELLDEPEERSDGEDFTAPDAAMELSFSDITYAYPNGLSVLNGCSFEVGRGKTVALVGASGCGKTTLFKLLCGYYGDYGGRININGHELREWNLNALRRNIAYVSQESYLFDATIRENIRYGRPDAGDDEIIEAAKRAYADDFINELENGYDTKLGERGVRLSGGQRQRIAIARAILNGAPLILLDEPTAALDTKAEFYVQQALDNLSINKTVFVVAHRISTVKGADAIVVLDKGRIIEQGSHSELVAENGRYVELYSSQIEKGGEVGV